MPYMSIDIDPSDTPDTEVQSWLQKLGPGLITGAADDDPSGIATYSQAGAQFGFNMLWTVARAWFRCERLSRA
jgi:Mn2+/Fe2+ NRAMP family transporter